ncbi:hypothetical protein D3C73_951360 [compost metagenome]
MQSAGRHPGDVGQRCQVAAALGQVRIASSQCVTRLGPLVGMFIDMAPATCEGLFHLRLKGIRARGVIDLPGIPGRIA